MRERDKKIDSLQRRLDVCKERCTDLEKKLATCDRRYEDLSVDYSRVRKRMQWLERKEEEGTEQDRQRRAKRRREEEVKEEIRFKVCVEEEERQKIRKELQATGKANGHGELFKLKL